MKNDKPPDHKAYASWLVFFVLLALVIIYGFLLWSIIRK